MDGGYAKGEVFEGHRPEARLSDHIGKHLLPREPSAMCHDEDEDDERKVVTTHELFHCNQRKRKKECRDGCGGVVGEGVRARA